MSHDLDSDYSSIVFATGNNVSRENNAESDEDFDRNDSSEHKTLNRHLKLELETF